MPPKRFRLQCGPISHPQKVPSKYWALNSYGRNSKEHNYPHSHDYITPSNYSFLGRGATRLTEGSAGPSSHHSARYAARIPMHCCAAVDRLFRYIVVSIHWIDLPWCRRYRCFCRRLKLRSSSMAKLVTS